MRLQPGLGVAAPFHAAVLRAAVLLASCHAAPVPEVAPSSPPVGPSDASEASSIAPEPFTPPLETGPSEPSPVAPADMPGNAPAIAPSAPSVAPPAEPPTISPPGLPLPPASPPELPSPPSPKTSRKPSPAPTAPTAPAPKTPGYAGYTGDQPCQAKTFELGAVERACLEGGRSAAKDLMKRAIANAKAKGEKLECTSCHVDQKTYALQPDAVKELQRWL